MKKLITLGLTTILAACACNTSETMVVSEPQSVAACNCEQVNVQVKTVTSAPCAAKDPCCCVYRPNPCREVLRPRIKEIVVEKKRRDCPPDGQMINCGCGNCATFNQVNANRPMWENINETVIIEQPVTQVYTTGLGQPSVRPVKTLSSSANGYVITDMTATAEIIPAMPEAYVLASGRAASRFLKDTAAMGNRDNRQSVYVKTATMQSKDLPAGMDKGVANFKRLIGNGNNFEIADTLAGADYYIETSAQWLDTPSKTVPAILYKTSLYDKNHNKINEWAEVIKKADNSQRWI